MSYVAQRSKSWGVCVVSKTTSFFFSQLKKSRNSKTDPANQCDRLAPYTSPHSPLVSHQSPHGTPPFSNLQQPSSCKGQESNFVILPSSAPRWKLQFLDNSRHVISYVASEPSQLLASPIKCPEPICLTTSPRLSRKPRPHSTQKNFKALLPP